MNRVSSMILLVALSGSVSACGDDSSSSVLIDLWTTDEPIESFSSNPDFQSAVGSLFDAPPTVAVYGSTDWYGW